MKLAEDERELLMAEVGQAAEQVRNPGLRAAYGELLTAVDQGEVPEELLQTLQTVLEVGLESGRVRRLHTAHGEMAATRLYGRTPKGKLLRESAESVTAALASLAGQSIQELRISASGPGQYSLTLATDQGTYLVRFDRTGVRLQSVEVG